MKPVTTVDAARQLIQAHEGDAKDFLLPIADELQDPVGINMAIVTDSILARGWQPDGYIQAAGFRIYKYKDLA
jgi:hypothetical protein